MSLEQILINSLPNSWHHWSPNLLKPRMNDRMHRIGWRDCVESSISDQKYVEFSRNIHIILDEVAKYLFNAFFSSR